MLRVAPLFPPSRCWITCTMAVVLGDGRKWAVLPNDLGGSWHEARIRSRRISCLHEAALNSYIIWIVARVPKIGKDRDIAGGKRKLPIITFVVIRTVQKNTEPMRRCTPTSKINTMEKNHQTPKGQNLRALRDKRVGRSRKTIANQKCQTITLDVASASNKSVNVQSNSILA